MSDVPTSVWQGSFQLFGVEVKCHVLSDGQRIIEADSMENLMEAMGIPGATLDHAEIEKFTKWRDNC
jgi:hypothetical protein